MNKLQKQIASAFAAGSLLLNVVTPVLGASYTISGNNTDSTNFIDINMDKDTDVNQSNEADVQNNVTVSATTGGNTANDVAGGEVSIDTGNASTGVSIQNELNANWASVETCGDCGVDGEFKISGNNTGTDNDISYRHDSEVDVDQDNDADVENNVNVTGDSGNNHVNDAVNGDVRIDTGRVTVNPVIIRNTLNGNVASVRSGNGEEGELSLWITNNNTDSDNYIDLDYDSDLDLDQENDADVENDVNVAGNSGENTASDVAGAEIDIDTGNVEVGVLVDTMANFNMAEVEDCCMVDLEATIANNNTGTDNDMQLDFDGDLDVDQDNDLECEGGFGYPSVLSYLLGGGGKGGNCADVDVTGDSGNNHVNDAVTGGSDPSIDTGNAAVAVEVSNSANVNTYGTGAFELPGGETSVDIDLDFGGLLEALQDLIGLLS